MKGPPRPSMAARIPRRKLARQHLVEHDPRRVDVAAMIDGRRVPLLLGRHVDCRANRLIGHGHMTGCAAGTHRGNTKSATLAKPCRSMEDVARLDIAMNDSFMVCKTECLDNLEHQLSHPLAVQSTGRQSDAPGRSAARRPCLPHIP